MGVSDLFRYSAPGVRTGLVAGTAGEYLSFDGGTTNIRTFNNGAYGSDEADWANIGAPHVQDAFGTPGAVVNYSQQEIDFMNGMGWKVAATPEPCTLALFGIGLPFLLRRKAKKA